MGVATARAESPLFQDSNVRRRVTTTSASRLVPPPIAEAEPTPRAPEPGSKVPEPVAAPSPMDATAVESDGSDEFFEGGYGDCCGPCFAGNCRAGGMWYGAVDYLLVRPRFSQDAAEVRQTTTTDTSVTPNLTTQSSQAVSFPFKYSSAFRASLGYRLLDCGGDINFTYWRFNNSASIADGPAGGNDQLTIFGNAGNNPGDGQFFTAQSNVIANLYDLDFARCLSFGGPAAPCDACFCPRWDLRWSAGVRMADISRTNHNVVSDTTGTALSYGAIDSRFFGAGPRVGMQGRRYFGCNGLLSLYARGNLALMLGNYRINQNSSILGADTAATTVFTQLASIGRLVPSADIEVGGSWQIAPYTLISAGWFFQCFWDLGQTETISGTAFPPIDTSNILGFDGLFIRGEMLF